QLACANGRAVAGQQLAVHTERPVEFTGEGENPRGREGNVELHLALGGNVLIDAERGDSNVVQRVSLALHYQRQLLPRLAAQEGRRKVIVVGLEFELRQLPHVLGSMVGVAHAAEDERLALARRRGARSPRRWRRGGPAGRRLHGDLARTRTPCP